MSKKTKTSIPDQSTQQENSCADVVNQSQQPKRERGRPSGYSDEIGDEICNQLMTGKALFRICQEEGMPSLSMVYRWIENPDFEHFREKYTHAKKVQAELYAEKIIDEAFNAQDAQLGRLRMDALRWTASKLLPKKYGDRIEHDIKQRTEISYSFAIPDRENIQLESGAIPPNALPDIVAEAIRTDSQDIDGAESTEDNTGKQLAEQNQPIHSDNTGRK